MKESENRALKGYGALGDSAEETAVGILPVDYWKEAWEYKGKTLGTAIAKALAGFTLSVFATRKKKELIRTQNCQRTSLGGKHCAKTTNTLWLAAIPIRSVHFHWFKNGTLEYSERYASSNF